MKINQIPAGKKLMAFSYFGGKNAHLGWLLPLLKCVKAKSFVDLLCGSGAVGLNMDCDVITINDINQDIANFFQVLRNTPEPLITKLQLTPYSQYEYRKAWDDAETDPIERARNFYIRVMQSFGSCGIQKEYNSWSFSVNSSRSAISSHVAKWLKGIDGLTDLVLKLKEIQIENRHYSTIIKTYASKTNLIYADPPYPVESRTGNIKYAFEFTNQDHQNLAGDLISCEGFVAVSGYRCDLMDELYKDFYVTMDRYKRTNNPKAKRQEALWTNYRPGSFSKQLTFL